jgi:hypothetical protein
MIGQDPLATLLEREQIKDAIARYARAVDRGDWPAVRAAYHPDAHDDHGGYKGGVDGLMDYLQRLLAGAVNGMHFLGNCVVDFAGPDLALAETYFISQRLRSPTPEDPGCEPGDAMCRMGWGRYVDRFERRGGEWRVAKRVVVMDAILSVVAKGGERGGAAAWGSRDANDPLIAMRREIFGE